MISVWVLLAVAAGALLLGWPHVFGWTHGQSSVLSGLGREARRFIRGLVRSLGRKGVYCVALLLTFVLFSRTEPFLRTLGLSQTADGWILLLGGFAFAAVIFFVLERLFGVYLWGRPRFRRKQPREAPRGTHWRHRPNPRP
jgi:hypothetical protein